MTAGAPPPTKHMVLEAIDTIIRTVDAHAREMNTRWGFNRLPHIVPIELTEKFMAQKRKWQIACFECAGSLLPADLDRVRKHGDAMIRAYNALEQNALAAGKAPAPPGTWGFETEDGKAIVLVRTRAEMGQVEHTPGTTVWCLEEIGQIITRFPQLVLSKQLFPDAEVIQLRTPMDVRELIDDEMADIPW